MKFIFLLFSFYFFETQAATKVAIIDAFFCQKQSPQTHIQIKKIQDMTEEKNPFGKKCENTRQFHGQKVLSTFLDFYKGQESIEIYLYKVFKKDGTQDTNALNLALKEVSKEKIDLVIMAIGFFEYSSLPKSLSTVTFASSGSAGNGINSSDKLWPQMLEDKKMVLFAHYFDSKSGAKMNPREGLKGHIDPSLMYLNKVNFLVSSPSNPSVLSGSSYAVAKASGMILSRCSPLKELEKCLQKESTSITILNSPLSKKFIVLQ
jgi:hypothetical protein